MKNYTLSSLISLVFIFWVSMVKAQNEPLKTSVNPGPKGAAKTIRRCSTMEELEKAIRNDPSLLEKMRLEGERQYQLYLDRMPSGQRGERTEATIIVPIVFHLVDDATTLAGISDRDILEQVEILNRDYAGKKLDQFTSVIPALAAARVGRIDIKFVLARRDPSGALTSGIERRAGATPSHVNIKSFAAGGLDAWDVTKYLNVWCGTFSGADANLLGIATFPFTSASEGPQGVVVGTVTLPYASNLGRSYIPQYAEGATLSHEIGHYFYLFHTFGDQASCNNNDFGIQGGWPLPPGAGPEGDDTPMSKGNASTNYVYGDPSMDYNDGCATEPFGILYGSYMNYFDDRALFMFTDGMRKRVEGCINLYRAGLLTSDGATPPVPVTDAYLLNVAPRGTAERRAIMINNTPFQAIVRNAGTTTLNSVTLNVALDAGAAVPTVFPLTLAPGRDTTLNLAAISAAAGGHLLTVYTSSPNGAADNFLYNDTLRSYPVIHAGTGTLPFTEAFTSATFPPANWLRFNPNGGATNTWTRDATSGSTAAGAAFFDNFNINEIGTFDELVTPGLDLGGAPGALLTFKVAHAAYDATDVSVWDGLEVYVSGNGGRTYSLAYRKTGTILATSPVTTSDFTATPAEPAKWRTETIDLNPYVVTGQRMFIKFRNVNAFGNNTYIDDISIVATTGVGTNDAQISSILNPANGSTVVCGSVLPVVTIRNAGSNILTSATINVSLNGVFAYSQAWTGSLVLGATANVTLTTPLNIPNGGTNTIRIYTSLPNGLIDAVPANDTATSIITKLAPAVLPVTNDFETAFLPPGWTLNNPNNDGLAWFRFNPPGGASGGSVWSAVIDNWSFNVKNTVDDIVTPVINTTGLASNDSLLISFDLAYKNYLPTFEDTLKVLVSNDCGVTWTTVWAKGGPDLATAGFLNGQYFPPGAADWKTQKPAIGNNLFGGGQILVAFRNVNGFGNVIWLDNINIVRKPRRDMQTTAIVRPNPTECAPPFAPSMTVRNNGEEPITGFKVGYILNGAAPVYLTFNIPLGIGASTTVSFPNINPPSGSNTIRMFVTDPITASIPGPDFAPANDTLTRTFFVPLTVPNIVQGFEGTTFIPANWVLLNPNNNVTWIRKAPGKASDFSAFIDNYNNNTVGQLDIMQAPPVNTAIGADSVIINFDVSHKDYPGSLDRLRVLVSTNCGVTFTPVYNKSGSGGINGLATAGSSTDDFTNPLQSEWRNETIRLNNVFTGGNIIVQFENRNDFGNNIFIDNINIAPKFKRDLEVLSVAPDVACAAAITPVATVRNRGTETVTAFTIAYTIGTGAPVIQNVTGITLASNATTNITLGAGTLVTGANIIKIYTSAPVTLSGTGDQYVFNDTLSKTIYSAATSPSPVSETFEGVFLPAGWALTNPDNSLTWQKAGVGARNSIGSAFVRNFVYFANGQRDQLYTPVVSFTGVDSIKVSFDVSAAARDYPGSTTTGLDTLEVLVTKDCGNTFTSVYKKWGSQLQTINDPNYPQTTEFTPNSPLLWRTENLDLTSYAPNGPLQLVFRNTTNTQNNVYVDNVNVRTVILPSRLKAEGVIVTPNPFSEQFNVWFVQAPADLRYITVLNSGGQLVWNKAFSNGSASNVININLSGMAAGVYVINFGYSSKGNDKQIRIIKSN